MSDYNETELAAFRRLIEERLQAIADENVLGAVGQSVVTLDQQAVGRLSRMDALQYQAMSKAQAARRAGEAARLRDAIARILKEDYGYCEDCGDKIPKARLEIDLTATRCVSCATG